MENDLLTNKSAAALLRDAELELVAHKEKPVSIRCIASPEWDNYINHDVTIPVEIANYLRARLPLVQLFGIPQHEIHLLEWMVEYYHGVKPPYHIAMSITLQQTGRPWAYVPEAGDYLTGFTLFTSIKHQTSNIP